MPAYNIRDSMWAYNINNYCIYVSIRKNPWNANVKCHIFTDGLAWQVAFIGTVAKQPVDAKESGFGILVDGCSKSSSFQTGVTSWVESKVANPGGGTTGGKGICGIIMSIPKKVISDISSSVDGVVGKLASWESRASRFSARLALRRSWDKWQKVQFWPFWQRPFG